MKWGILFLLVGCSASQQIATSATLINRYASEIKVQSISIQNKSVDAESVASAKEIEVTADRIICEVDDIQSSIPKVADITPWWATLFKYGFAAVAAIALVIIINQTGLSTAIRLLIGWIPRKTQQDADLAVRALDPTKEDDMRTWVAAKRSSDPLFNAAWEKAKAT
jgi:hypothetical protein